MEAVRPRRFFSASGILIALAILLPAAGLAQPCVVPDNGTGTVDLPPPGCGYLSPSDVHMIIDGLPKGTTINVGAEHRKFFQVQTQPGGPLGGEIETFQSFLFLDMQGTGELAGFQRFIQIQVGCEIHTGPRNPGDPVQDFDNDMFRLQGQLPPGDPDFDLLRITAGTGFGLPSPGHTTLTRLPDTNDWNVDSFFDIAYEIEFQGAPGSVLEGFGGTTTGTIRMGAGEPPPPPPPCVVQDNGTGTVDLPPIGCGYLSPSDVHMMIDGLPPGTTVNLGADHSRFGNVVVTPGGPLGGEIEQFTSTLFLDLLGTGELQGYMRDLQIQAGCEVHTGPRQPGKPVQEFDNDMFRLQGQLPPGDPDFDILQIRAGTGFGLPSPGHTTLTLVPGAGGSYNVDSFFDVTYEIEFQGAPGGPFEGLGGVTTGTIRMGTGQPATTGVGDAAAPARRSELLVNRPDPFNPSTMIEFTLATEGRAELEIYDASGRLVRRMLDQVLPAGLHQARWDGLDGSGQGVGSGTYFIKLRLDGEAIGTEKAAVVK